MSWRFLSTDARPPRHDCAICRANNDDNDDFAMLRNMLLVQFEESFVEWKERERREVVSYWVS